MRGELTLSVSTLLSFLLVLSRIAGTFVFIPLPVREAGPGIARVVFALACTIALFPSWPSIDATNIGFGQLVAWILSEAALGTAIGLMVGFIGESLTFGAQILSIQAGYGYVSVVDPMTKAESDVLPVLAQVIAGLLFFTSGLHRYVILAFAKSLESRPPGTVRLTKDLAQTVLQLGGDVFSLGLRLAFPILALLLMTELALGLIGRVNAQLQLGAHAFPVKMAVTLLVLTSVLVTAPTLYSSFANEVLQAVRHSLAQR
jgi:flagellar biosynthetic protein FliR